MAFKKVSILIRHSRTKYFLRGTFINYLTQTINPKEIVDSSVKTFPYYAEVKLGKRLVAIIRGRLEE